MTTRTAPQHGERACYLRGCRRPECVTANKRYCKQYRAATVHHPVRIDASPLAAFLDNLADQGYSHVQIATAAGRHDAEISKIRSRQQAATLPEIARAYMRIRLQGVTPAHAMTTAIGTIRRGQALHAIGYPIYRIAEGLPMACNHLGRLLDRQPPTVRLTTANQMTTLYEQWRWKPGPSRLAVFNAQRREWYGPLAWDNIDDPKALPDVGGEEVNLSRNESAAYRRTEIEHLDRFGVPVHEIATRLDMADSTVKGIVAELRTGQKRDRKAAA